MERIFPQKKHCSLRHFFRLAESLSLIGLKKPALISDAEIAVFKDNLISFGKIAAFYSQPSFGIGEDDNIALMYSGCADDPEAVSLLEERFHGYVFHLKERDKGDVKQQQGTHEN